MHFAGDRRTLCVRKRKPKIYHETESLFLLSGQFLKLQWSLLSWIQKLSFNNPLAKANQQTSKKFLVCKKRTACLVLARKKYCMLKRKISAKPLWSYDFFFYINKRKPRYTWVLAHFWNENLVVKNIKYITYDGNPSRKRFIDLLFRNKNQEVSTLVALERLRAEMTRKTSSPILTKSKSKKAYRVYDR